MKTARPALRLLATLAAAAAMSAPLCAQPLLEENFEFLGPVSSNGWVAFSAPGTNALTSTAPSLTYPNLPSSGVGNAVTYAASGEDAYRLLSASNSTDNLYTSFTVNVASAQSGDYFYAFYNPSGGYTCRVFARTNGSGFSFGISRAGAAVADTTYETNVRAFNTTYLVVAKLERVAGVSNDVVGLWVNPTLGVVEPAPQITNNFGGDLTNVTSVAMRQAATNSSAILRIDSMLVGTNWADVTPTDVSPNSPVITSFSPATGPAGTSVSIVGSNFTGTTNVAFNGVAATFSNVTATNLSATVPSNATTGLISVATTIGTALSASNFVVPAPTITSFTPTSGPAGTTVTIVGSNFTGATNVAFNGLAATFSNVTATNLSATVPVGALTGPISVAAPSGTGLSSSNFLVPTVAVVLPASINEGGTGTGELRVNEAPTNDITVTLTSSSTNDLTVDTPVTIFASTTNSFFNIDAPLDNVIDGNTNVTVTPSAAGYSAQAATITVVNVDQVRIPLTTLATNSYFQDFNSLGTATISNVISPTNGVQTSLGSVVSTSLDGWFAAKIGGSGAVPTGIVADNGSNLSGNVYNYGATNAPANTNRSLGALASGTTVAGFGALIKNETGSTLNSVWINLTGKFWRSSTSAQNVLTFGYGLVDGVSVTANNFISAGGVSSLPSANIVGPPPVVSNGALDGNNPTNQILITNVAIPIQLAPGETMFIRWQDVNDAGNDAGLAIDDLNLTASTSFAAPVVASVVVDPFSLTEAQASVSSSVISDSGGALTGRGFVYSETLFNSNPVIGGPSVTVITNSPAEVGAYTNLISGLLASTSYTVKSYAIGTGGTNYSSAVSFNTLAPSPAFNGYYFQSFNGLTNTDFPAGWRCLSTSNANSYAGDWNSTNATVAGFYGRTNIPGILGYLHGASTGILSNRLTLVNNTGGTLTNLWVSYVGEVNVLGTNNTRFPEWTVVVDGQTNSSLAYSTAGGTNAFLSAEVTGLNISNGANIVISWSSDRGTNATGASRMIGMTSVRVATNAPGTPTINVSGSLVPFSTVVSNASSAQSFTAGGSNLVAAVPVTAPTDYEVSLDNIAFFPSVNLGPTNGTIASTPVYVRIAATAPIGNPAGLVSLTSLAATTQNVAVTGTVSSGGGGFTTWVAGGPTNAANVGKYAIGGASSPTANNGVPSTTTLTSSNLFITAIVRTNDPNLTVIGQSTTNLATGPWATNVTMTVDPNQLDVPPDTQRQIFSTPRDTNTSLFMRLRAILLP